MTLTRKRCSFSMGLSLSIALSSHALAQQPADGELEPLPPGEAWPVGTDGEQDPDALSPPPNAPSPNPGPSDGTSAETAPPPGYGAPPPMYYGTPNPPAYYAPPGGPPPPPPKPTTKRNSTGAMVTGIVFTGLGGLSILAGAVYVISAEDLARDLEPLGGEPDPDNVDTFRGVGIGMLIGGGVFAAVGLPLLIWGAQKHPVAGANDPPQVDSEPSRMGSTARLVLGPNGAAFRGTF